MTVADPRFYNRLGPFTVEEIAALSGAAISDSGTGKLAVTGVAALDQACAGHLSYAEGNADLAAIGGAIIIIPPAGSERVRQAGGIALEHAAPRSAFAAVASRMFLVRECDQSEAIHSTAEVDASATIAVGAVIGAGARIGANVRVMANAVIGAGCVIGDGSSIGPGVSLRCTDLGNDCNILAGAVIGEAGFGVAVSSAGVVDVPHLGTVVIGNGVTIGANTTIDRGVFGRTRIGDRCKIDNLCHIAHNCQLGQNVLMPGYSGLAGSVVVEDDVMFGGRIGVYDHVRIGRGAKLGANSTATRDIPAGEVWTGMPAQPMRQHMRELAELRRLTKARGKGKKGG
jgi:UDP-3-O-[3-hydroxymyristoyl] glucosamine N-acyltransferase